MFKKKITQVCLSKRLLKYKPASAYIYDMDISVPQNFSTLFQHNVREPDKKRFTKAGSLVRQINTPQISFYVCWVACCGCIYHWYILSLVQRWDYDILKSFRQEGRLGDIITLRGKVRKKSLHFHEKFSFIKHIKNGKISNQPNIYSKFSTYTT